MQEQTGLTHCLSRRANHYDSSFESWAMAQDAVCAACTETPGLQPVEARIQAHAAMIKAFVMHAGVG